MSSLAKITTNKHNDRDLWDRESTTIEDAHINRGLLASSAATGAGQQSEELHLGDRVNCLSASVPKRGSKEKSDTAGEVFASFAAITVSGLKMEVGLCTPVYFEFDVDGLLN